MYMVINVHEYGRGGKCVSMFRYTYAGINTINMQIDKGDRHTTRFKRTSRAL